MRAEFLHGVPVASAAERRADVVPFLNRDEKGIEIFSGMARKEPDLDIQYFVYGHAVLAVDGDARRYGVSRSRPAATNEAEPS
jgi:hypothetical protein